MVEITICDLRIGPESVLRARTGWNNLPDQHNRSPCHKDLSRQGVFILDGPDIGSDGGLPVIKGPVPAIAGIRCHKDPVTPPVINGKTFYLLRYGKGDPEYVILTIPIGGKCIGHLHGVIYSDGYSSRCRTAIVCCHIQLIGGGTGRRGNRVRLEGVI